MADHKHRRGKGSLPPTGLQRNVARDGFGYEYSDIYDDDSDDGGVRALSSGDEDNSGLPEEVVIVSDHSRKRSYFRRSRSRSRSSSRHSESTSPNRQNRVGPRDLSSSSEDEANLEGEMARELADTVEAVHREYKRQVDVALGSSAQGQSTMEGPSTTSPKKSASSCLDDIDIDSVEKDKADEQLFYDSNMDVGDEQWVNKLRSKYCNLKPGQASPQRQSSARAKRLPNSDAVLNCPACMAMLCLDCQRHETFTNQYRAMFVFNCKVDHAQSLRFVDEDVSPKKPHKRPNKSDTHQSGDVLNKYGFAKMSSLPMEQQQAGTSSQIVVADVYKPVHCSSCDSVVGVFDHEEVYHFFNVLASHS